MDNSQAPAAGLDKKETIKRLRQGSGAPRSITRETCTGPAQDYRIKVIADAYKHHTIQLDWQYAPESAQKDQQCGLFCLRTNLSDWDETRL